MQSKVHIFNRCTKEVEEEKILGHKALSFLYESDKPLNKNSLKLTAKLPLISRAFSFWQRLAYTKKQIEPFVKLHKIDLREFEKQEYTSFNDFFTRKLKHGSRKIETSDLICPTDSRVLVFPNLRETEGIYVKGQSFSLTSFLQNETLAAKFLYGSMGIFRLAPPDYHWVHSPLKCNVTKIKRISGPLFSVNPIALRKNISYLFENKRVICELETEVGQVLAIFVGATNVGSIHLEVKEGDTIEKGDPLGYFSFGGSCVVFLFEPNKIQFSLDLIQKTNEGMETLTKMGEVLASFSHN